MANPRSLPGLSDSSSPALSDAHGPRSTSPDLGSTESPGALRPRSARGPFDEGALDLETKSAGLSYLLLAMGVFGVAGLHRFYLGRPLTGLIWLFTFGLFGLGTFIDLFLLPRMVEDENIRLGYRAAFTSFPPRPSGATPQALPPPPPEQAILRMAKDHDGRVTVPMVALETGLSLRSAERALERICQAGHAERDVSSEGASLYVFPGLRSNAPFDLDEV